MQGTQRWSPSLAATVVLVGAFGGVSAIPVDSQEPIGLAECEVADDADDFVPRPGREQGEAEAMAVDTMKIAENEGWTFEEAQRRLATQEAFAEFSAPLRVKYPDSFTGAWLKDGEHDAILFVRFVGAVPDEVPTQAKELGLEVNFLDDARYTAAQLEARNDEVTHALVDAGYRSFTSGSRVSDEKIHVSLTRPPEHRGRGGETDDELRQELPLAARASDVIVEFMDGTLRADVGRAAVGGEPEPSGSPCP